MGWYYRKGTSDASPIMAGSAAQRNRLVKHRYSSTLVKNGTLR